MICEAPLPLGETNPLQTRAIATPTFGAVAAVLLMTVTGARTARSPGFRAEDAGGWSRTSPRWFARPAPRSASPPSISVSWRLIARVPRHESFPRTTCLAYLNRPLPIGHGQTISQPYIVAIMTDLLKFEPGQRALEIGTGSGYQAAILGELGGEVYTIEIIEDLGEQARRNA